MYERKIKKIKKRRETLCHVAKAEKWQVGLHYKKGRSPTSFYHPKINGSSQSESTLSDVSRPKFWLICSDSFLLVSIFRKRSNLVCMTTFWLVKSVHIMSYHTYITSSAYHVLYRQTCYTITFIISSVRHDITCHNIHVSSHSHVVSRTYHGLIIS